VSGTPPRAVTRSEMQALDRRAIEGLGIPGLCLMENAGRAVAQEALRLLPGPGASVALLCGKGNNGGDGFVAARHLAIAGARPTCYLFGRIEELRGKGDAGVHLEACLRMGVDVVEAGEMPAEQVGAACTVSALVVDALFGTGLDRPLRAPWPEVIHAVNGCERPILAVDLPSGLDADTGLPLGAAVRATLTVTMALPKLGFSTGRGPEFTGKVIVVDIGMPVQNIPG